MFSRIFQPLRPLTTIVSTSLFQPLYRPSLTSFSPSTSLLSFCRSMATRGQEYQPSTLKRKRKFGFLRRLRTPGGRKILKRRMLKGRKYLSW